MINILIRIIPYTIMELNSPIHKYHINIKCGNSSVVGVPKRLINQLFIYIKIAWLITSFSFALRTFFEICLVSASLSYLASLSLCYDFSFLYSFLFIHHRASVGVLKKLLLQFWKKMHASNILGNFRVKYQ